MEGKYNALGIRISKKLVHFRFEHKKKKKDEDRAQLSKTTAIPADVIDKSMSSKEAWKRRP